MADPPPVHCNGPNQGLADRHHRTPNPGRGFYLCSVKDAFSNRIVGHSIDIRMRSSLARAIQHAITSGSPTARSATPTAAASSTQESHPHPPGGTAFRARWAGSALPEQRVNGIVSLAASKNVLDTRTWDTRDQLRHAIVYWIEAKYNRGPTPTRSRQAHPVEYETVHRPAMAGWLLNPE